ncbi:MAG: hypothetical protein CME59_20285 [Halioglobus sp.]|nr:hypothetical protein [Halioglobus sp.]
MSEPVYEARVIVDPGQGVVLDCDSEAARLLGASSESLQGAAWHRALRCDGLTRVALGHALQSRRRVKLPPFILRSMTDEESVVGAMIFPDRLGDSDTSTLLLWDSPAVALQSMTPPPDTADTLAVLGVDQFRHDAAQGPREVAELMSALRASLLEIVRTRDVVSRPAGTSLAIALRDVDLDAASDICTALLSHLHRAHGRELRIRLGLARMSRERSALATLLAANNALLQGRALAARDTVRREQEEDFAQLVAAAINAVGIFGAPQVSQAAPVTAESAVVPAKAPVQPVERDIEGYVVDNMEGAVDQALYLARLDIPVAIIGPAGTGKMYVAKIMHEHVGGAADMLSTIDCREFRSRGEANKRIGRELASSEGRTLVFKSPHLMNGEAQAKLARQIRSRRLADADPPRALPAARFIALFPDTLERLVARGQLDMQLASAFAGMPIQVPPIRDRKQAVLRWAHKILLQEGARRDRDMRGFTPDAERAMLQYEWPGNISEMRQCICDAMDKTDKNWLTPVDLGLFQGIEAAGTARVGESRPFLEVVDSAAQEVPDYAPSSLDALDFALAEAVHSLLQLEAIKPLGTWLDDDLVSSALERYRGDARRAADFLHTRARNISRWLPKIQAREEERNASALWQEPRRRLREWVRESPQLEKSPMQLLQGRLLAHVEGQGSDLGTARRAGIMGVSTPTYLKRVREQDGA